MDEAAELQADDAPEGAISEPEAPLPNGLTEWLQKDPEPEPPPLVNVPTPRRFRVLLRHSPLSFSEDTVEAVDEQHAREVFRVKHRLSHRDFDATVTPE